MKNLRRTLVAIAIVVAVSLGFVGAAGAVDYTPVVCTEGQTVVDGQCVEVQGQTVEAGVAGAEAVAVEAAGTLPYTGNDSSLPLAEIGVALLAAGGLMVVLVRRRQAGHEA